MGIHAELLLLSLLVGASVAAKTQVKPANIAGVVKETGTGKPIADARVEISSNGGDRLQIFNAVTGDNGEFTIRDVASGRYTVAVNAQLYYRSRRDTGITSVTVKAEEELRGVEILLRPTGVISGRVVDESGEPLRHVVIEPLRNDYLNCEFNEPNLCGSRIWSSFGVRYEATTDDRGEYRIFNLEPGTYRIRARDQFITENHGMFYPGVIDPQDAGSIRLEAGQERAGIDLVLKRSPEFAVKFKLAGAAAKDFDQTVIYFRRSGNWENERPKTKHLADGSLRLEHLSPGSYELFALVYSADSRHTDALYSGMLTFSIRDEDVDLGSWSLHPSVPVTGQVRTSDTLTSPLNARELRIVFLEFDDNLPGIYFEATRDHKRSDGLLKSDIAADGRFNLGNVAIGRFRIQVENLPPNTYLIAARSGVFGVLDSGYLVTGDQDPLELTIGGPGSVGTVEGRVIDVKGNPVARAAVVLVPPQERRINHLAFRNVVADDSGAFRIGGILPGSYRVLAWEDLEPGAGHDPEFLKGFEGRGQTIEVTPGFAASLAVEAIPGSN